MNFPHLTTEAPETFPSANAPASPVLLNTEKLKFKLIAHPTMAEIRLDIERHARLRREARWQQLMEPRERESSVIRLLQCTGGSLQLVESPLVWNAFGVSSAEALARVLPGMSLEQQRGLAAPIKPQNTPEMLALYRDTKTVDMCGFRYLSSVCEASESAAQFFGTLIESLFQETSGENYALGYPKLWTHQARVFELLGLAVQNRWLLFPFLFQYSEASEHRFLSHFVNVDCYFNKVYRPVEVEPLFNALRILSTAKTTQKTSALHLRNLITCSTFRRLEHSSVALFQRCLELMREQKRHMSVQGASMARRSYNHIIKLHNSEFDGSPPLAHLSLPKQNVTMVAFSSFQYLRDIDKKWNHWANSFESFLEATQDSQGQIKKTTCREFGEFLISLKDAPMRPELTSRSHINDYSDSNPTYRNYLRTENGSPTASNRRLQLMSQFFGHVHDRLRSEHQGPPQDVPWFPNPVDVKFDRFKELYRAGSNRKAVAAGIVEMMRNILVENDYAWSKENSNAGNNWTHLVNIESGELEHVWCPSSTLALYTVLTLPLRGGQGRLLDSGEGDSYIYDFDSGQMVPNPKQLPVDGRLRRNRKEGALQVMASGMLGVTDFVGVWICTNKTSDTGYSIPWVSEDLLKHWKYQRDWIFRYSQNPNMHGVTAALGHRNHPIELEAGEPKFYCLFRDPSAERMADHSLPVSKQKLYKLWAALCAETERRINSTAKTESERVTLVRAGEDGTTRAIFDIHTLRVSGITDLLDRGVPLNIVCEYVAGHATEIMTLWYDKPSLGMVRQHLLKARAQAGDAAGLVPNFSQDELDSIRPYLISNPNFKGMYTGFDAIEDNKGLVLIRQSGICPGTRCEEGAISEQGRAIPVPTGDRGPSCPQCRFWLTGPAFLLGQAIEGNQLIFKIRNMIQNLKLLRDKILDAEDEGDTNKSDILRGQTDVQERQLNDMLAEWWNRIRFYDASIQRLDEYRESLRTKTSPEEDAKGQRIILLSKAAEDDTSYSLRRASDLELKYFLSTCAEVLPEFSADSASARQDIELAVGKFLAINNENELSAMYFKLGDQQRLTAANLSIELMLRASNSPIQAADLLEGRLELSAIPDLQRDIQKVLAENSVQPLTISSKKPLKVRGDSEHE